MPRLNVERATEFWQVGIVNGFDLWRRLIRKLDPRSDVTFHTKAEIQRLSKTVCKE